MNKKQTQKVIPILIAVLLLAVLIPTHLAKAGFLDFSFSSSTLGAIVNGITTLILGFVEKAISFFAGLLDTFITYQTQHGIYGITVVNQSWGIIRDFVNMLFILVLIVIAFGTIFDISKFSARSGGVIVNFIIAALLINFSLVIGQYIITFANDLSGIFLREIQSAGGVSVNFAQGFNQVAIATSGSTNLVDGSGAVVVTLIFSLIFLTIVMLAFATAAIFTIVRLFMLWFLLILSPIAWLGYSLPNLRGKTWSSWWTQFLCWCFFLPYYLFFVMFAVMFIKSKNTLPFVQGSVATGGLTGNDFMFYALSLIFLIGGLYYAKKMACASGSGIKYVLGGKNGKGGIENWVKKYAPGASYLRALRAGASQAAQRVKEEGLPGTLGGIYGGAQAEKQRAARAGEKFEAALGFRPRAGAQKEFSNTANKEFEYIKQQLELGQTDVKKIRDEIKQLGADNPRGFAQRKMLAEVGQLDPVMAFDTIRSLRENPFTAVDFVRTASKSNFSAVPAEDIRQMAAAEGAYAELGASTNYLPARREIYKHIQSDAKTISGLNEVQFEKGIEILGGSTTRDGTAYLKDVGKVRPDLVVNYNVAHPKPNETPKPREQIMAGMLTNAQEIGSMPMVVWNDKDFKSSISSVLSNATHKARESFFARVERSIIESGKDTTDKQNIILAIKNSLPPIGTARP